MLKTKIKFRAIVLTLAFILGVVLIARSSTILSKPAQPNAKVEAQVQPNVQNETPVTKETENKHNKAKYYDGSPKGKKLELTAAHKTFKKGTIVRVESLEGSEYKPITVEITDHLPDIAVNSDTIIDLSRKAAIAMSPKFIRKGYLRVKLTVIE